MEFGLVSCCYCYSWCSPTDFVVAFILFGLPGMVFWIIRIGFSLSSPLSNANLTQIEFPLLQIPLSAPYEPIPVSMMVGSCSEAKRCAYCHEEFDCDSARRFCFACNSATHEECAVLNGGCSVFGCADTTLLRQA
jgi:hypothetical protein